MDEIEVMKLINDMYDTSIGKGFHSIDADIIFKPGQKEIENLEIHIRITNK